MRTKEHTKELLKATLFYIQHRDWYLTMETRPHERLWAFRWNWKDRCSITNLPMLLTSRAHWIDDTDFPEDSRLVDAVVKLSRGALHEALRHEADEFFLFKGKRLYDPHITIATLQGIHE